MLIRYKNILFWGALGALFGVGVYTFHYAEGFSYFSTDPKACTNCHIMQSQFDSWQKASHHTTAACVDCHLPRGFIEKYVAKADNGYRHSKGFTFQDFHEPILIGKRNSDILQENCLRCHQGLTHSMMVSARSAEPDVRCIHCHSDVGHGEQVGLGGFDQSAFLKKDRRSDEPFVE